MSFENLITIELNGALSTINLNEHKAIKNINKINNLRNKLLKDINNLELQYYLIKGIYTMAEIYKNEALMLLYNKLLPVSGIKGDKITTMKNICILDFICGLLSSLFILYLIYSYLILL